MQLSKSTLGAIFVNLKTTFQSAFDAAPSTWQKIAMLVPSSSGMNVYKWLSNFTRMKKWVGDKQVKAFEAFSYTIVNDDWEATVEVDRNDIKDDQLGIYSNQANMAGFSAKQLPDEIVYELVDRGFTNACFDGQYFFDTDHPVTNKDGTQGYVANRFDVALSIESVAKARASYGAARTNMKKFKDNEGRPLNVQPTILLVPPALEDIANALMTADRLEDGKTNPYKGTAEVVCDARLTSDTAWFLLDVSKPVKPFIYQEREAPYFVQQTDMASDDVFSRKTYKFGAEARAAGGYGFWQLAFGSTGTQQP